LLENEFIKQGFMDEIRPRISIGELTIEEATILLNQKLCEYFTVKYNLKTKFE
jgi:hypothetical protein